MVNDLDAKHSQVPRPILTETSNGIEVTIESPDAIGIQLVAIL
jgi:hypothetical protein